MKIKMKLESADSLYAHFEGVNETLPLVNGNDFSGIKLTLPRQNSGDYSSRPSWADLNHAVEIFVEIV